ncbi:MAG: class I SAM-dependent methyltransferase [Anaerolineales bacterium]
MPKRSADEYIQRWDRNAAKMAEYVSELGDRNKEVLLTPLVLDWLGDIRGQEILDAGCGEGFLCRLMAERGAKVTGVDLSGEMLKIARQRTPPKLEIDYQLANLENLSPFQSNSFDTIVSTLALQDVQDYQAALQALHRVLRPGGGCFLAFSHPCFLSDGGWVRDQEGKKLHWKTDRYFLERDVEMRLDPDSEDNPIGFHRTLSSYYRAIKLAGFIINDLIEPYPSPEAIEKHPNFKDDLRMCHFIVFDLEKENK